MYNVGELKHRLLAICHEMRQTVVDRAINEWCDRLKACVLAKGSRTFLQRVSIACYAERCISYSKSVRPSVRPSVRRWHCVKTTPATIMRSSLEDSPMTLVS